jgi:hypothetical protein
MHSASKKNVMQITKCRFGSAARATNSAVNAQAPAFRTEKTPRNFSTALCSIMRISA